ncbi:MAG: RHS domain-containing protein [Burkholderiales bacterium]|nr:RHS domain-containing protein [Burkholderiales bacterium]
MKSAFLSALLHRRLAARSGSSLLTLALAVALGSSPAHAQGINSTNGLTVTTPNGYAVISRDDMALSSEAGMVRWGRQWDGQEWRFNPHWESLSQSWKNLTGSQSADTTSTTVTSGPSGGASSGSTGGSTSGSVGATAVLSSGSSGAGGSGGGCWVWVDEDWQPSYGTAVIGGLPQAEPVQPARLSPFNKVMGEDAQSYAPLQRVSVDYASLCAGAAVSMPPANDVEAIRRNNELYLGDNGRYAFSNRAVLEKREVKQIAAAPAEALYASLGTGRIALSPQANDKGYRWLDKSGDWIDYNTQGQVVAYGDRNNNTVWLARDTGGRLLGVVDPRGRVLYTLHYTGQLLTEVKDHPVAGLAGDLPARSVKYAYDERNRLVQVTDVRGHVTKYDYNVSNRLIKITDAEGRSESLAYTGDAVSRHTAADGAVTDYVFEFDDANKQFISKVTGPQTEAGRRVEDLTHNRAGKLVRQIVNGRTDVEVRYDTGARAEISTNARGFTTRIVRNEFEQVVRTERPDGATDTRVYSPLHLQLTQDTDALGVQTQYQRDAQGNLVKMIEAVGTAEERVTEIQRDARGQLQRLTRKGRVEVDGRVTPDAVWQVTHDELGQVKETTDPEGHVRRYVHDRAGHLRAYTDPRGHTSRYDVDAAGQLLKSVDSLARERTYTRDKVGNVTSALDARAKQVQATYDALNRRITLTNAVGGTYKLQFNAQGLPVKEIDEDGRTSVAEFDNFMRLTREVDGLGHVTTHSYNVPDGSAAGQLGALFDPTETRYPTFTQRQRYDALERPTSETLLNPTQLGTEGLVSGAVYDRMGRMTSMTDPNGKTRYYTHDALGRLTETKDSLGNKTTATYDARGNLILIKDANGNVNRFDYDRNNRLVLETLPLGQITTYGYDAAGNLARRTDPNGHVTQYQHDKVGRVTEAKRLRNGATLVRTTTYTWNAEDQLTGWTDIDHSRAQTSSATLTHDDAGRKLSESVTFPGGQTLRYQYAYSLAGLKTRVTWPDDTAIDHSHSAHGQWQGAAIPGEGSITVAQYKWIEPSQVTLPGGTTQNRTLNGLLYLEDLKVKSPGQQTVLAIANTWGKVQELQSNQRTDVLGTASSSRNSSFTYDGETRLTAAQTDAGGVFGGETETYTLDAMGNRIAHSRVSGAWTYDANNRLTQRGVGASATTYQYDAAGNLTQKTEPGGVVTRYRYDTQNRLIEVADGSDRPIARYGYDPLDRRIWKEQFRDKSGPPLAQAVRTLFLHSDEGLLSESRQAIVLNADLSVSALGEPQLVTAYGLKPDAEWGTGPLFVRTANSAGQTVYAYFHHDQLQTPVQATDKAGNVVWAATYNAFGRATITTPAPTADKPTITSALRLPGQYEDAETGLHHNYRRYYDPETGRYITQDPIGTDGGFNLHLYAEGDPINRKDATGECPWCAAFAVCMASCALETAATNAITGECNNWGDTAKDCALGCAVGMGLGRAAQWAKRAWDRLPCAINSFPADTLVHVRPSGATDGDAQRARVVLKPIAQLQVGDEVLAFSEWASPIGASGGDARLTYEKVVDVFTSHQPQHVVHLTLASGESLQATEGHPFLTREGWRDAILLKRGGQLLLKGDGAGDASDWQTIADVRLEKKALPVFNIEVANSHTYFVGEEGALVHNGGCNKAKSAWRKARETYWKARGHPDGKPPTREVRARDHKTGREYDRTERKELHHKDPQRNQGSNDADNLDEVWPTEHADRDPFRRPGYDVIKVYD